MPGSADSAEIGYNIAMLSFRVLPMLLALLPLFCCLSVVQAATPALSIVPDQGTVIVTADTARWEFAPRSLSDEEPLTHLFYLRNATKDTLMIERVAVSCDCVQAKIGEASVLPVKVLPGQTVPVSVSLSMHRLVPGTVSKSAWLYLHGGRTSGLRLEMHGTVYDGSSAPTH